MYCRQATMQSFDTIQSTPYYSLRLWGIRRTPYIHTYVGGYQLWRCAFVAYLLHTYRKLSSRPLATTYVCFRLCASREIPRTRSGRRTTRIGPLQARGVSCPPSRGGRVSSLGCTLHSENGNKIMYGVQSTVYIQGTPSSVLYVSCRREERRVCDVGFVCGLL